MYALHRFALPKNEDHLYNPENVIPPHFDSIILNPKLSLIYFIDTIKNSPSIIFPHVGLLPAIRYQSVPSPFHQDFLISDVFDMD